MIVVADTSPLNYLLQINCESTLPALYKRIIECERLTAELLRLDEREDTTREEKELAELQPLQIDEYETRRYPIRRPSPQHTRFIRCVFCSRHTSLRRPTTPRAAPAALSRRPSPIAATLPNHKNSANSARIPRWC
jgi:hypothetical protein